MLAPPSHEKNEHHPDSNQHQGAHLISGLVLGVPLVLLVSPPLRVLLRVPSPADIGVVEHVAPEHLLEEIEGVELLFVVVEAVPEMVAVRLPPVDPVRENIVEAGARLVPPFLLGIRQNLIGRRNLLEDFFAG